jgi:hypothetical protein
MHGKPQCLSWKVVVLFCEGLRVLLYWKRYKNAKHDEIVKRKGCRNQRIGVCLMLSYLLQRIKGWEDVLGVLRDDTKRTHKMETK